MGVACLKLEGRMKRPEYVAIVTGVYSRALREDRDLTQKEVAAYLHCDQSLYSKYERGERLLPLDRAVQLADYYGVTLDYLTGRTNTP